MKINFNSIKFKNIFSYGNRLTEFNFENGIDLVTGKNGNGKCLRGKTKIEVEILDEELKKKFLKFIQ